MPHPVARSAPPQPGRGRPVSNVPWDWTDVALFFAAFFVGLSLLSGVLTDTAVASFGHGLVRGLSPQLQTALGNFTEQTAVYALAMAILLGLVMGRRHARLGELGWRAAHPRWLALAVVTGFASTWVLNWLLGLEAGLVHVQNAQVSTVQGEYGNEVGVAIVLFSLIAPLAEETFFRGFIYGWMRRHLNVPAAALLSGCFFAAAHAGWGSATEEILFLPLALLGALLALLYEYSGSLLPGAAVHGLFNLLGTLGILG